MNDDNNTESIYSYEDTVGETLWTPNVILAHARAEYYGSDVSVEVYDVPPTP
jgi:hypothetical protein